jgi:hypothetical protein
MQTGTIVKLNTWRFPKAKTGVVLRTYRVPDDGTLLVLPCSSTYYEKLIEAIKLDILDDLSEDFKQATYADSKTVFSGEWKTV